jgi:hypothetical protein
MKNVKWMNVMNMSSFVGRSSCDVSMGKENMTDEEKPKLNVKAKIVQT